MPAISTMVAVAGLAVAGTGAVMNYQNTKKNAQQQSAYQSQALAEQQHQDELRKQQMNLDAMRRQRATLRASLQARAQARTTAVTQGAQFGSVLAGAYGGIAGQTDNQLTSIEQGKELGTEMFASNTRLSGIYRQSAMASADAASNSALYGGLTSLGGAMMNSSNTIDSVGTWLGNKLSTI